MTIKRLHHAQITVDPDQVNAARAFYCDVLGLREIPKPNALLGRGGFWLEIGDQQIHVGTETDVDRLKTKAHIAYEVDDLAYWRELVITHNLHLEDSVPIPGFDRIQFRDPFGNRVELIQPLP